MGHVSSASMATRSEPCQVSLEEEEEEERKKEEEEGSRLDS